MIDIKFLRENPEVVKENIRKKFQDEKLPLVDEVIELDAQSRTAQKEADDLRANRMNSIGVLLGSSTLEILLSGMAAALLFCIYQIRRRVIQQICRVELWAGTEHVTVDAYCDTGNLLRDPLTGRPVCILQQEVLAQFAADRTIQKEISCHTIGTEKEKLKIVMLDKMKIYQKGTVTEIKEPEIGLHTGEIMQNPKVQMLLHAGYIR